MKSIVIMIPYPTSVGFAIGRLVTTFFQSALAWAGDPRGVHFCFTRLDQPTSPDLPHDFSQIIGCDYLSSNATDLQPLADYVWRHGIRAALALDMPVESSSLRHLRAVGLRTVTSYWGAPISSINSGIKLAIKRIEVRYVRRWRPDYFIFESEAMRRFAVFGRGINPRDTAVIPTGVDAERFYPDASRAGIVYERFDIPKDRKIVVYMGHLHRRKGIHVLLEAMSYLVNDSGRRDLHCLFLGNRTSEVEQFTGEAAAARGYVTFGGYHQDVPDLLRGCYAGVIPSTGWDSFPMSSLEMQATGIPVIVSDCQGTPETIANGLTGMITRTGDSRGVAAAIDMLASNPTLRSRMGIAARLRIESGFTLQHHRAALREFLNAAVDA